MAAYETPGGHNPDGGVVVGSTGARRLLVLYEDPQCPFCRRFERRCGDMLRREIASGSVAVDYRMRSFLGPESVRANNALALAAEANRFDQLRAEIFAHQPPEHTGGFTPADLIALGAAVGLDGDGYVEGVIKGKFEPWARQVEARFAAEDPDGTPAGRLQGQPIEAELFYDPEALGALLRA